jgi:hypothetical protein
MCASRMEARPCPYGTANDRCVCRRFASESFFRSFPSPSCPGLTRASMQKSRSRSASTGARRLHLSMDHRQRRPKDAVLRTAMSGGDESEQWRGIARALTRAARTISLTLPWRGARAAFGRRTVQATPMRSIGYRTADARGGVSCFEHDANGKVVFTPSRSLRSRPPPPGGGEE